MPETIAPERLLKELDELWVALAKPPEGEESGGVMRACAFTLIAVSEGIGDDPTAGRTIAELMHEHPCRAILLFIKPSAERLLEARVTAQCWMPFGGRQQICCEQIEVTAAEQDVTSLPEFILPLTAPDLPVVIWFRHSRLALAPGFQPFFRMADTVIVDSAQIGGLEGFRRFQALAGTPGPRVADLAWTRLTPWREIVAQIFENPVVSERRSRISEVTILVDEISGLPRPAEVYYLAAWLALGLEFRWDGGMFLTAEGKAGLVIREMPGGTAGIEGITMAAPDLEISVKLAERSAVEVRVNAVARNSAFPPLTDGVLLREELSIADGDPVFEESVRLAEQLASHEGSEL